MAPRPSPSRRSLGPVLVAAALAAAACGGGEGRVLRQGDAASGHVTLRFSGAVNGTIDQDTEVACFAPAEKGDRFTVSIDSDTGLTVGPRELSALDVSVPDYDGPKAYDLVRERDTEESFDADEYFLLFEDPADDPFLWGKGSAAGTVTIDEGEESGRLSLRGWENSADERLDVEGTFRCGRSAGR
jgi:hypothetical protein